MKKKKSLTLKSPTRSRKIVEDEIEVEDVDSDTDIEVDIDLDNITDLLPSEILAMNVIVSEDEDEEEEEVVEKKPRKRKKPSEKPHYVNGKQFEDAIRGYYETDIMTDYLGDSLRKIACGLSFAGNFINYSYRDEMIGDAIVKMYQALKHKKFKLDHGFSPFSYFTTIAYHAFISRIKKEKKHHQLIEDYKEKHFDQLMNADDEMKSHRVYTRPGYGYGDHE